MVSLKIKIEHLSCSLKIWIQALVVLKDEFSKLLEFLSC